MNVSITEIITRSTEGVTKPFLCRGDDGCLYYVKGRGAGWHALISEWLAGNLGKRMGLPIPDFKQAIIPEGLIAMSARDDIAELGSGVGFASRLIPNAGNLTYSYIDQIEDVLRAKILLFDWWTLNGDRTLTEHGGNPNILWVYQDQKPYVIDHNLAFDETSLADFWATHVFAPSRTLWTEPYREDMEKLMPDYLKHLDTWWKQMPPEWTEVETDLKLEGVNRLLWRFQADAANFWCAG